MAKNNTATKPQQLSKADLSRLTRFNKELIAIQTEKAAILKRHAEELEPVTEKEMKYKTIVAGQHQMLTLEYDFDPATDSIDDDGKIEKGGLSPDERAMRAQRMEASRARRRAMIQG